MATKKIKIVQPKQIIAVPAYASLEYLRRLADAVGVRPSVFELWVPFWGRRRLRSRIADVLSVRRGRVSGVDDLCFVFSPPTKVRSFFCWMCRLTKNNRRYGTDINSYCRILRAKARRKLV